MDVSRLMILLKEAWSRARDEGVGVMEDFIGKPFTATLIVKGKKTINDVPPVIREQVKQILIDLDLPELAE